MSPEAMAAALELPELTAAGAIAMPWAVFGTTSYEPAEALAAADIRCAKVPEVELPAVSDSVGRALRWMYAATSHRRDFGGTAEDRAIELVPGAAS